MEKEKTKKIKVVVTGGGTGGHIMALMAVVKELKKHNCEIIYIGSGNKMEKESAKKESINYKSVMSGKFRRYFSWENFIDPFKIVIGFKQSLWHLTFNRPDIIFAKGGYVTYPVVSAGWVLGIPIITHESDSVMGLANKMEAKMAKKVCVGFPIDFYKNIPLNKLVFTGNPIREDFADCDISIKNKKNKLETILITGGSQGARFINQIVAANLRQLTKKYYIIHIAGKDDYQWLNQNRWPNYKLCDYTDKMPEFMRQADLVVSRAGANTLAEISACGKPSILIPLPTSANNHQQVNAKIYEKKGAAIVLSEKGLTSDNFLDVIENLMADKKLLAEISANCKEMSEKNSTQAIVNEILNYKK